MPFIRAGEQRLNKDERQELIVLPGESMAGAYIAFPAG